MLGDVSSLELQDGDTVLTHTLLSALWVNAQQLILFQSGVNTHAWQHDVQGGGRGKLVVKATATVCGLIQESWRNEEQMHLWQDLVKPRVTAVWTHPTRVSSFYLPTHPSQGSGRTWTIYRLVMVWCSGTRGFWPWKFIQQTKVRLQNDTSTSRQRSIRKHPQNLLVSLVW